VGEALVSFLDAKGRPSVVERAFIVPPGSKIGPISEGERKKFIEASPLFGKYEKTHDKESAYEKLKQGRGTPVESKRDEKQTQGSVEKVSGTIRELFSAAINSPALKSLLRAIGSQIGREIGQRIIRGVFGSISWLGGGVNPKEGLPRAEKPRVRRGSR
jgi:hypothetical protein